MISKVLGSSTAPRPRHLLQWSLLELMIPAPAQKLQILGLPYKNLSLDTHTHTHELQV